MMDPKGPLDEHQVRALAKEAADAMLEGFGTAWRSGVHAVAPDTIVAVIAFGRARLRFREAVGQREEWEC